MLSSLLCLASAIGSLSAVARADGPEPVLSVSAGTAADSPSPLGLRLDLAGEGEPGFDLRSATLTLPRGLSLDPSVLSTLRGCSPAQVGLTSPPRSAPASFDTRPVSCPAAARLGVLEVESPLAAHPLRGALYLASPGENPYGATFGLYAVLEEPEAPLLVKFAGRLTPDLTTGQLTVELPEIAAPPLTRMTLAIPGGPQALFTLPPVCGEYAVAGNLVSEAGEAVSLSGGFRVSEGPAGSPCAAAEAAEPNHPGFAAGTLSPLAGVYSPLSIRLTREDGAQPFGAIDFTLPPGLLGRLAGIGICSDAQISSAEARGGEGEGAAEIADPSCPASSQLGTIVVDSGSGEPLRTEGRLYLSGPFRGAPLSVVAITPALVGPFDLGVVVDRVATYVNPVTAQIEPVTETVPRIVHGIPLDIRSISIDLDRDGFILNPTNCDPLVTAGAVTSVLGQPAPIRSPFQALGCDALPFKPRLRLRLRGGTRRGRSPALIATLSALPGEANSAAATVVLPRTEFAEQAHIRSVCTRVQFAAHECPPSSIYGYAKVITPLLEVPEAGPVYMRSSSHGLPDLVVALRGPASQPIEIDLDSRIDAVHGRIRSTFEVIPDAPISRFELHMEGGRRGLLVNSADLCTAPKRERRAAVRLTGQNGKRYDTTPLVEDSCPRASSSPRGGPKTSKIESARASP